MLQCQSLANRAWLHQTHNYVIVVSSSLVDDTATETSRCVARRDRSDSWSEEYETISADEVVDISGTPVTERGRRIWLRIGVPVGGVALIIDAILGIALHSNRANRSGVLLLSDNLLAVLQDRIAQQVATYVNPATRAAQLARDIAARIAIDDPRATLEAFASSELRQIPQIDALYTGDATGNFMMVRPVGTAA